MNWLSTLKSVRATAAVLTVAVAMLTLVSPVGAAATDVETLQVDAGSTSWHTINFRTSATQAGCEISRVSMSVTLRWPNGAGRNGPVEMKVTNLNSKPLTLTSVGGQFGGVPLLVKNGVLSTQTMEKWTTAVVISESGARPFEAEWTTDSSGKRVLPFTIQAETGRSDDNIHSDCVVVVTAIPELKVDQTATNSIKRLYQAYFLRTPDAGGLAFWLGRYQSGMSLVTVSDHFAQSREFTDRYGRLNNRDFIDRVYRNVLGRAPDSGGMRFWLDQLNSGQMNRGRVMVNFSESAEFKDRSGIP